MTVQTPSSNRYELFTHGNLDAFEEIFRAHEQEVYSWLVRIVRDRTASEDLTIEVFWRIYRARARFDPHRSFEAWARRIATNAAMDHLKKQSCNEIPLQEECVEATAMDTSSQKETRELIERAFCQLPIKLGVTARLALIEELPYREIAEALGISEGSVKLRVFRATRILRKKLKQAGMEP